MDTFTATMIVEGVDSATDEEVIEAWATLIKSGVVWHLQGWFGRQASLLIKSGVISDEGEINWERFDEDFLEDFEEDEW